MTRPTDLPEEHRAFAEALQLRLRQSESLSRFEQQRLAQSRAAAIAALDAPAWQRWLSNRAAEPSTRWLLPAAAALLAAVALLPGWQGSESSFAPQSSVNAELDAALSAQGLAQLEFAATLEDDTALSPEFLRDLEFYRWLGRQPDA